MAYDINFIASNRADWSEQVAVTDKATDALIDFSDATIVVDIRDKSGFCLMAASISSESLGVFIFAFTKSQMGTLCAGSYQVGCLYEINNITTQLFTGSVSVYDGIARL